MIRYQIGKQQGVALFIVLILLVVLTTLSLSAMRSAITETKISSNHQHKQLTFQVAENMQETLVSLEKNEVSWPKQIIDDTKTDEITVEDISAADLKLQGHLDLTYKGKGTNILVAGNEQMNGLLHDSDAYGFIDINGTGKPEGNPKTHTRALVLTTTPTED